MIGEGYLTGIFIQIGINVILALSLYLTFSTGQISLGHAGFMAIGGYFSSILTVKFGFPLLGAMVLAGLLSSLVGILVGYPALRLKGIYLAIATMGFGIIVQIFFQNFNYTGGPMGFQGMRGTNLILTYATAAVVTYLIWRLMNSRIGRAFEAVNDDEIAAEVMGIDITRIKILAFLMGAGLAGIAGALDAHYVYYIDSHNYSFMRSVEILLFLIMGGSQVVWGPILGAAIFTSLPELLRFMAGYRMIFYGFLLIFMMIFRPQGILDRSFQAWIKNLNPWKVTPNG